MSTNAVKLQAIRQLDEKLLRIKSLKDSFQRPRAGWIAAVRKTLGMSNRQLAERMGVAVSRISKLESSEVSGATTLQSLERAADAMGCELVYTLVPRTSLREFVGQQARKAAEQRASYVDHHMALEAQSLDKATLEHYIEDDAQTILRELPRWLWNKAK
ncbi:MAG: mobile mystery protein A [Gammaproteobacteria bacterium]|nr:mobile mystery protein A [Gammaproteobacteria bacterium]